MRKKTRRPKLRERLSLMLQRKHLPMQHNSLTPLLPSNMKMMNEEGDVAGKRWDCFYAGDFYRREAEKVVAVTRKLFSFFTFFLLLLLGFFFFFFLFLSDRWTPNEGADNSGKVLSQFCTSRQFFAGTKKYFQQAQALGLIQVQNMISTSN